METHPPPWTLGEISRLLGGKLDGPADFVIRRPITADTPDPHGIAFAESPKFVERAQAGGVGAILVRNDAEKVGMPSVRVENPRSAFALLLAWSQMPLPLGKGIHATAVVDPGARVDGSASVGPYAVIEKGAVLGPGVKVYPFCYVGEGCVISEGCVLYPHAVLYRDVALGPRSVVHSGAVIGADGFGYVWDGKRRVKVPQAGCVQIGADAEIGANSTIDRATAGETTIGDGTKIDNLVQIAHNVNIGRDGAIAALSGIAGSAKIGDRVMMGGSVMVRDHTCVGDDVALGGRTQVDQDIVGPGEYWGTPFLPMREAIRSHILLKRLPELFSRLKELERRLLGSSKNKE